jgi:hypothetical protein
VTAHVLRLPRRAPTGATSLHQLIRQHLQMRADVRLRCVPDHLLGPATDASDAAITRRMATHAQRIEKIERVLMALIEELDGEAQQ